MRIKKDLTKQQLETFQQFLEATTSGQVPSNQLVIITNLYAELTGQDPRRIFPCRNCGRQVKQWIAMIKRRVEYQARQAAKAKPPAPPAKQPAKPKAKKEDKPDKRSFAAWRKVFKKQQSMVITSTGGMTRYALEDKRYTIEEWQKVVTEKCTFEVQKEGADQPKIQDKPAEQA